MFTECPEQRDLQAYSLGTLAHDAAQELEVHLAACIDCQETIESLESVADEVVLGIRDTKNEAAADTETRLDELVERIRARCVSEIEQARLPSLPDAEFSLSRNRDIEPSAAMESPKCKVQPNSIFSLPNTREEFVGRLAECGLVSNERAAELGGEYYREHTSNDAVDFARWLVEREELTFFQANELCWGRQQHLRIGDYLLMEEIGRGGMGCVYKAHHVRMKRTAALKVLLPRLFEQAGITERFEREIRAISRLAHPHVVIAYDAAEKSGVPYLAMEFIDGANLGLAVQTHGPLPVSQAVNAILQAACGLSAAHRAGIIHRDVKPTNLLLSRDGNVKVSDLGLARLVTADESGTDVTETGQILGTFDYISPEQAGGAKQVDERSDIYSLGCTLYYLLTGEVPFPNASRIQKLESHRHLSIPSLRNSCPDVSEDLDRLFQRMVAKSPGDRPQSMAEVVEVLESFGAPDSVCSTYADVPTSPQVDLDSHFQQLRQEIREANRDTHRQMPPGKNEQVKPRYNFVIAAMLAIIGIVFGTYLLVVGMKTAEGEVVIEIEEAFEDELEIRILDNQEVVATLDSQRGWHVRLNKGTYSLVIGKGKDRFQLDRQIIIVEPDDKNRVRVSILTTVNKPKRNVPVKVEPSNLFGEIGKISLPDRINSMVLSADKKVAYAGCSNSIVYVVDLTTKSISNRLKGHANPIIDMAVSPDGNRLATCGGDRTVRVWDVTKGEQITVIRLPVAGWRVTFSPDGKQLLVAFNLSRQIQEPRTKSNYPSLMIFDPATGNVVMTNLRPDRETFYWSIAYSPNGDVIAAGSQDGRVDLFDTKTGERIQQFHHFAPHGGPIHSLVFPSNKQVFSADNGGFVLGRSVPEGDIVFQRGFRHPVNAIEFSSDESRLLLEGTIDVRVLDNEIVGEQALTNLHGHQSPITGLLFLDDESQVVSCSWDRTIRLWKLPKIAK